MPYKILGISGSPVKKGNVDSFLASIMGMASEQGLDTETVSLSEMEIMNCKHCNFCLSNRTGVNEDQARLQSGKAILSRAMELHEWIHEEFAV